MVNFTNVAIFLLGTSARNMRFAQKDKTLYESRLVPIMTTWGSYFPLIYFVFGRNKFDYTFLNTHCTESFEDVAHRSLLPRVPQMPTKDEYKLYNCPLNITSKTTHDKTVNVLYTGNCTGEYFGIGPTCRCQEAMRFFLTHQETSKAEWFIFMDDDIYYRPYSLVSMLYALQQNQSLSSLPFGVIAANLPRSPANIRPKKLANLSLSCSNILMHTIYLTQPAFLNRNAMTLLSSAVHANGMTRLHTHWGSSHDALLGMLLWMYDIPLFSVQEIYYGGVIIRDWLLTLSNDERKKKQQFDKYLIFHKIMNYQRYKYDLESKKMVERGRVVDQYDIVHMLGEQSLYTKSDKNARSSIIEKQVMLGQQAAASQLIALNRSSVHQTRFLDRANGFPKRFYEFMHTDCEYRDYVEDLKHSIVASKL